MIVSELRNILVTFNAHASLSPFEGPNVVLYSYKREYHE